MPEIVVSEFMDVAAVEDLAQDYEVLYDPELVDRPEELGKILAEARGLVVRNRTQVTDELLAGAPRLEVVGRLGVGLDNIDVTACAARGVRVCPATGANAAAVAEYVVGATLVLTRGVYQATAQVIAGEWPRTRLMGGEIAGRRLGLVGLGTIAREVARRARSLGMVVAAHDPYLPDIDPGWGDVERLELGELLRGSHVISLHVPLDDTTRHLIDANALAGMMPGAILINTSRGGVVDEAALSTALAEGRLGGAALDVFEREPLDAESGATFAGIPNLLLTPHIAGITEESNVRVSAVTAENVRRALAGDGD